MCVGCTGGPGHVGHHEFTVTPTLLSSSGCLGVRSENGQWLDSSRAGGMREREWERGTGAGGLKG